MPILPCSVDQYHFMLNFIGYSVRHTVGAMTLEITTIGHVSPGPAQTMFTEHI